MKLFSIFIIPLSLNIFYIWIRNIHVFDYKMLLKTPMGGYDRTHILLSLLKQAKKHVFGNTSGPRDFSKALRTCVVIQQDSTSNENEWVAVTHINMDESQKPREWKRVIEENIQHDYMFPRVQMLTNLTLYHAGMHAFLPVTERATKSKRIINRVWVVAPLWGRGATN